MIVLEISVDLKDVRAGINPERKEKRKRSMLGEYQTREKGKLIQDFASAIYPLEQLLIYVRGFREI
jgi:hypothetical protein